LEVADKFQNVARFDGIALLAAAVFLCTDSIMKKIP
jgi:hypothetical protein